MVHAAAGDRAEMELTLFCMHQMLTSLRVSRTCPSVLYLCADLTHPFDTHGTSVLIHNCALRGYG
eukprot:17383-Eustigmatos_ZCMA.PRE.1